MIKLDYLWAASKKDVDVKIWSERWPNFSAGEVACKGSGEVFICVQAMDKLQQLRQLIDKRMTITSAYRSGGHNKAIGGSPNSQHVFGRAFDIAIIGGKWGCEEMFKAAAMVGFTGIGKYDTFVHVDLRPNGQARWDNRQGKKDGSD